MTQYDVIIVGGGLVGASLALALADSGRKIALLEGSDARFEDLEQGWDARIYAVSPLNRRFLEQLQAWPDMSASAPSPAWMSAAMPVAASSLPPAMPVPARWPGLWKTAGCWPACGSGWLTVASIASLVCARLTLHHRQHGQPDAGRWPGAASQPGGGGGRGQLLGAQPDRLWPPASSPMAKAAWWPISAVKTAWQYRPPMVYW
jgi:hypothetical protein